jgi:hypothetical protein
VWAFELTQRAGEIQRRLEGVAAIKFVPGPLPEASGEPAQAAPEAAPRPTSEQSEQAAAWAAGIEDEELRKLVQKAAESSLARPPNDRSF